MRARVSVRVSVRACSCETTSSSSPKTVRSIAIVEAVPRKKKAAHRKEQPWTTGIGIRFVMPVTRKRLSVSACSCRVITRDHPRSPEIPTRGGRRQLWVLVVGAEGRVAAWCKIGGLGGLLHKQSHRRLHVVVGLVMSRHIVRAPRENGATDETNTADYNQISFRIFGVVTISARERMSDGPSRSGVDFSHEADFDARESRIDFWDANLARSDCSSLSPNMSLARRGFLVASASIRSKAASVIELPLDALDALDASALSGDSSTFGAVTDGGCTAFDTLDHMPLSYWMVAIPRRDCC